MGFEMFSVILLFSICFYFRVKLYYVELNVLGIMEFLITLSLVANS